MIGLVIASHGQLAQALASTAAAIVGPLPALVTRSVEPQASAAELRAQLAAAVAEVDEGDGVVLLTDLIGGSPCSQSLALCTRADLEVVTGVNLPMLLKANALRSLAQPPAVHDFALQLVAHGQRSVTCASEAIRARPQAH